MHDDIQWGKLGASTPRSEDLSHTPLQTVTNDRFTDFSAGGDSEASDLLVVGVEVKSEQGAVTTSPAAIAAEKIGAAPHFVMAS